MAFIDVDFFSQVLVGSTAFSIILPQSCPFDDIPTVYLLHGYSNDHTDWSRRTKIEQYAEERGIAVVMPDGENGFYTDMKYGRKHLTYITEELVDYTRRVFRLSHKREKTYVCGQSMGGYGAFLLALRKPEVFGACASLSGCVDLVSRLPERTDINNNIANWGEDYLTTVPGSEVDLMHLVETFPADKPKPRMYSACGRQDFLYENNQNLRRFMEGKGFEFRYEEGDGAHTWPFWDTWVVPALDFMLETAKEDKE